MDTPDIADAKHLGPRASSGAKRAVGLGHGLPDEILIEVLHFSGLREFAACAAASSEIRGGLERLSPALGYQLVTSRFPTLALMFEGAETTELPPPRELFESQARLVSGLVTGDNFRPTRDLHAYTFFLEVANVDVSLKSTTHVETLWSGKGGYDASGYLYFSPPLDLWEQLWNEHRDRDTDRPAVHREIHVNIMAARRSPQGMQRTLLGSGAVDSRQSHDDYEDEYEALLFSDMSYPHCTNWIDFRAVAAEAFHLPTLRADWRDSTTDSFQARFLWSTTDHEDEEMSIEDVCLALEHYFTWV